MKLLIEWIESLYHLSFSYLAHVFNTNHYYDNIVKRNNGEINLILM